MTDTLQRAAWERQTREPEKAYQAFLTFRDRGPGRTVTEASRTLLKSRHLIDRWCQRYNWRERAARYDAATDLRQRAARLRRRTEAVGDHILVAIELAEAARAKIRLLPLLDGSGNPVIDPQTGAPYLVPPDAAAIAAAAQGIDKAIKHHRLALGLPTEHTKQDVALRDTLAQALETQQELRAIIEGELCPNCRDRIIGRLARLTRRQAELLAEIAE
jgi:hypothetical protein